MSARQRIHNNEIAAAVSPHAVLIIDDELALARNIATYLRRIGFVVRTAGSAEDGLAALAQFRPSVVLCDHNLPGMSGLEATQQIRRRDGAPHVVVVSGSGSQALAGAARRAGATAFLTKPVALSEVRALVERLVAQHR